MFRRPPTPLLLLGALSAALHAGYVLLASVPYLETRAVVDDTFYYWMIARRFWESGFFTFDGIHVTNGFQPLWQWLLLPLGLLGKPLQFRLSLLLGIIAYQVAAWLLACSESVKPEKTRLFQFGAVLLWTNARFLFETASSGMEFGLYLAVAIWAVMELTGVLERRNSWTRLLLATALLPLARVDGLGLSGLIWLTVYLRMPARRTRAAGWGILSIAPFVLWLLANQVFFDSALPVSGTVKRLDRMRELEEMGVSVASPSWFALGARDTAVLVAGNVFRFFSGYLPPGSWGRGVLVTAGAILGGGVVAAGMARVRLAARSASIRFREAIFHWLRATWPGWLLTGFGIVQALVYSYAIPRGTAYAQWYYGPFFGGLVLVSAGCLPTRLCIHRVAGVAMMLLALHIAALAVLSQPVQIACQGTYGALEKLEALDPLSGTRVGSWNAGLVAFRAPDSVAVINLDGLVNTAEFAHKYTAGNNQRPYLKSRGIRYLVDYATGKQRDSWREVLHLRLGDPQPDSPQTRFEPLYIGPLPEPPATEPRRYHLLRVEAKSTEFPQD